MLELLQRLADRLYDGAIAWAPPEGGDLVAIGLGSAAMLGNIVLVWRSAVWGTRLQDAAVRRMQQAIAAARLLGSPLSPSDIRARANSLQRQIGCAYLTDGAVAEAVRAEADGVPVPDPVLEGLVVKVRDPGGLKLMSVANTNRLLAYALTVGCLAVLFVTLQLNAPGKLGGYPGSIAVWLLAAAQLWLAVNCVRAAAYWRGRYHLLQEEAVTRVPAPPPRRLSRVWDFFVWMAGHQGVIVHCAWGPIWEQVCVSILPNVLGMYGLLWLTDRVLKLVDAPPETVRQVVLIEVVVLLVVFYVWHMVFFTKLHEYRWHEAGRLRRRRSVLYREWKLYLLGIVPVDPRPEFAAVGRRLWVLTGRDEYREPITALG